jgi:hypothetical protein
MAINPYPIVYSSTDLQVNDFISDGVQALKKRVRFQLINEKNKMYNLSICTVLEDGTEDCNTASRNGDMDKIFKTIAQIVLDYTTKYPNRKIYFEGSDTLRVRQYQLTVFSNHSDILPIFFIEGIVLNNDGTISIYEYIPGKNYKAFIFTRK